MGRSAPRIEPAGVADLAGAYRVCLLTGDAGVDATGKYRDPDLLGHVYVGPYLARGRDTQLVAVDDEGTRGSGMGRTLIERLLADLRTRGIEGVHFGVDARNVRAIGFYEHLGFRTLQEQPWGVVMGARLDRSRGAQPPGMTASRHGRT
jgi:GNAT superfamily N-acetyltransferase